MKNVNKNTKLDNTDKKLNISDVSCSYIDLMGDIALIERKKNKKWVERNGLE